MASSSKRRTMETPAAGRKPGAAARSAGATKAPVGKPADAAIPAETIETGPAVAVGGIAASAAGPGGGLVDAQVRTLAELCEALDRKCLDLLEDVAAARNAHAASERELAELRETRARELDELTEMHDRELAEARRTHAMLEKELAALRSQLERAARAGTARGERMTRLQPSGQPDAARLQGLLESRLAGGTIAALEHTTEALARFGAAGMVNSVGGTRAAPTCQGWLLSRADLDAEPLLFLLDDAGLLGWTDANRERLDVNRAFPNTKPRPGYIASLSRAPVGRLRGIVAMDQDGGEAAFFEVASVAVPEGLFSE